MSVGFTRANNFIFERWKLPNEKFHKRNEKMSYFLTEKTISCGVKDKVIKRKFIEIIFILIHKFYFQWAASRRHQNKHFLPFSFVVLLRANIETEFLKRTEMRNGRIWYFSR